MEQNNEDEKLDVFVFDYPVDDLMAGVDLWAASGYTKLPTLEQVREHKKTMTQFNAVDEVFEFSKLTSHANHKPE